MRDGVQIAVDVHAPNRSGPLPTILRQTRYLRSLEPRLPFESFGLLSEMDLYASTRRRFLRNGYVWVDVDVRGSGASQGRYVAPWSPDEVRDGAEIVNWIVGQSWSNGRVGALGISYDGTCAEMLLVNQHPAVLAVAPMYSLFDIPPDVAFPGGIHLSWFTEAWARYNAALDRDAQPEAMAVVLRVLARAVMFSPEIRGADRFVAALARTDAARFDVAARALLSALVRGVAPVQADPTGRAALRDAIAQHVDNVDVHQAAKRASFRDQAGIFPNLADANIDLFSPAGNIERIRESKAAVFSYGGWRDSAYPHAAIKRYHALRGGAHRLILGPWVHSGKMRIVPFGAAITNDFDQDGELLSFFDHHLKHERDVEGQSDWAEFPVRYFTFCEERWKRAPSWPPLAIPRRFYLAERRLADAPHNDSSVDTLSTSDAQRTGERSRWRNLLSLVPGDYPDRVERDLSLLTYDSEPLTEAVEMTGHPLLVLYVSFNACEGHVFAYIEDIDPSGRIAYVTEGQLSSKHRAEWSGTCGEHGYVEPNFTTNASKQHAPGEVVPMVFSALPISYLFARGHRIRLAIAADDLDHFSANPSTTIGVHRAEGVQSYLELPFVK